MPIEYIVVPAVAMTILPRLASRFETWRKGKYKSFTWPKFLAKMLYMFLAFLMLFVDFQFSMAIYFGVIVYLLNGRIGALKGELKKRHMEHNPKDPSTWYHFEDVVFHGIGIALLGIVCYLYCTTEYGCLAMFAVLVPYGLKKIYECFDHGDEEIARMSMSNEEAERILAGIHAFDNYYYHWRLRNGDY